MTKKSGIPIEQDSSPLSNAEQVESLPHIVGWAKILATRSHFAEQVEVACSLLARGDFSLAEDQFRDLLQVALRDHDVLLAEVSCHNLAIALRQSGRLLAAETWQQQSLAWRMRQPVNSSWQSDDDLARLACDLTSRGCEAFLKCDWDIAEALWRRALAIEEWRGSWEGCATDSGNLGLLAAARGDLETATQWLQESLRLHQLMFDGVGIGTDLLNLAEVHRLRGEYSLMTHSLREAVISFERVDAQEFLDHAQRRLKEAARIDAILRFDPRLN